MHEKRQTDPLTINVARETQRSHNHPDNGQSDSTKPDGMVAMARENEHFHLAPMPSAVALEPDPFPRAIFAGLGFGIVVGALLGVSFARLLLSGAIVVPGWEQLFSISSGTFTTFWLGMGIALGLVVGGVGAILLTRISAPAVTENLDLNAAQNASSGDAQRVTKSSHPRSGARI